MDFFHLPSFPVSSVAPIDVAALATATGHPDGHRVGIVVAVRTPVPPRTPLFRRRAKLTTKRSKRIIEHPRWLESWIKPRRFGVKRLAPSCRAPARCSSWLSQGRCKVERQPLSRPSSGPKTFATERLGAGFRIPYIESGLSRPHREIDSRRELPLCRKASFINSSNLADKLIVTRMPSRVPLVSFSRADQVRRFAVWGVTPWGGRRSKIGDPFRTQRVPCKTAGQVTLLNSRHRLRVYRNLRQHD